MKALNDKYDAETHRVCSFCPGHYGSEKYTTRPPTRHDFCRRPFPIGGHCHKIMNSYHGSTNVTNDKDKIDCRNGNLTYFQGQIKCRFCNMQNFKAK